MPGNLERGQFSGRSPRWPHFIFVGAKSLTDGLGRVVRTEVACGPISLSYDPFDRIIEERRGSSNGTLS